MPKAIWSGAVIAESDHTIKVEGKTNPDGAWYYPAPFPAAAEIKDHVAFWHGVRVTSQ